MKLTDLLVYLELAKSKSKARRLIQQNAVSINGKIIKNNVTIKL